MENTWVKLFRSLKDWCWYTDANTMRLFVHLVIIVNWKPSFWKGIPVDRGQTITSVGKLSEQIHLSEQQIRTALNKLKSTNEITIKSTNRFTKITVLKYSEYQSGDLDNNKQDNEQPNNQITNKQQTDNKRITTIEEVNNSKNSKEFNISKKNKQKEIPLFPDNSQEFNQAFEDFAEMRKESLRKPLKTKQAKLLIFKKLKTLSNYEDVQIQILEQSTMNSWQGLWPIGQNNNNKKDKPRFAMPEFDENGDIIYE